MEAFLGLTGRLSPAERLRRTRGGTVFLSNGDAVAGGSVETDTVFDERAAITKDGRLTLAAGAEDPDNGRGGAVGTTLRRRINAIQRSTVNEGISVGGFAEWSAGEPTDEQAPLRQHHG